MPLDTTNLFVICIEFMSYVGKNSNCMPMPNYKKKVCKLHFLKETQEALESL